MTRRWQSSLSPGICGSRPYVIIPRPHHSPSLWPLRMLLPPILLWTHGKILSIFQSPSWRPPLLGRLVWISNWNLCLFPLTPKVRCLCLSFNTEHLQPCMTLSIGLSLFFHTGRWTWGWQCCWKSREVVSFFFFLIPKIYYLLPDLSPHI